jgi:lipopolysaccharide transport system permease protein
LWDFFISFLILVVMMGWYKFVPGWQILPLHFFVAIAFLVSLGPSLWITALNVKDFRFVTLFLVQVGIYVSPIGFSSNVVPDQWPLLYSLNPMIGVIDGFRWCILGEESQLYLPGFGLSIAVTAFLLWFGVRQFRKMEKSFVDII